MSAEVPRYRVEWMRGNERLLAEEPSLAEVEAHAEALAAAYNEPHNRAMMTHSDDHSPADVVAHFEALAAEGSRAFLLFRDGALAGDADFRSVVPPDAEFAILIASRIAQGRGLGTAFARMLHLFAFRALGLERVYATVVPSNAASLRLFEKLGYRRDDSPQARAYADAPDDASLSLARGRFDVAAVAGAVVALRGVGPRSPSGERMSGEEGPHRGDRDACGSVG
jgi:RimJ/RimL family protein N-acetyltransferase